MKLLRYIGFCIFAFAAAAHAQYGRYQNCQLQNAMGQAVAGAQVYILTQPANTAALTPQATIYSNATGAGGAIPQPVFTDGFGQCSIYAAPGLYTVVYNSPLTGILVYPDQIISTTGGAVFTPTGVPYVTSPTANTVATIPQIQNQAGLGVHTNAYLEPNSSTFLYSPLSCATSFTGPTCIDATAALQAAQAAAALTGGYIYVDAAPPGFGIFKTQIQMFNGEGGIICEGRHYEQGCPWYQIPGYNGDGIVPNPGLPAQGYLDYYLIDGMAFYGDFTYTSTTGNCINFGPLRVAERTEVNRTTCNSWPNNGFYVSGGSDPLYFTDTEASGNGSGAGEGYGWNFYNSGGNTFDMVTLQGWSADNNVSGAINIQNPSNYGCVTCGDTFIFRSGKMESRYDNIHYPDGQPVGINLNNTSGTPVIIDGLSAISVDPAGAPITTVVRNGSGTMVITTPTPHPPAHVGSLIAMNGNSQSVFNLPAVFTVTASTQTTTTVSMSGGALTGTGGNMFYKVVTDELVNITGNSANVKLNGVTMAGGQDAFLGPFGWYNIINDQVNGFENNITSVPNHSTANGGSWVSANYTYPNFCADFQCLVPGNAVQLNPTATQTVKQPSATSLGVNVFNGIYYANQWCTTPGTLDQSCIQNAINDIVTNGPVGNAGRHMGVIHVSPGVYTINSTITIPSGSPGANISIQGEGQDSVWGAVLKAGASHPNIIQVNADSTTIQHITFIGDNLEYGIQFGTSSSQVSDTHINWCWFNGMPAMHIVNGSGFDLSHNTMELGNFGIYSQYPADVKAQDLIIDDVRMYTNTSGAIFISGDGTANFSGILINGIFDFNGGLPAAQVTLQGVVDSQVRGYFSSGGQDDISITADGSTPSSNITVGPFTTYNTNRSSVMVNTSNNVKIFSGNIHNANIGGHSGITAAINVTNTTGVDIFGNHEVSDGSISTPEYGVYVDNLTTDASVFGNNMKAWSISEYDVLASGTTKIQTLTIGNSPNTIYRCVTAGSLAAGALTGVAGDCGTSVDTGLRTN